MNEGNLTLYYIRGINDIDTMYFSNIDSQRAFMSNHSIMEISSSFYPPNYKNTIKFSDTDIDFNTPFNYLSIYFNNKYYYYFVSRPTYINENLISIDIIMDTIQTFMFNIKVNNAIIERKFIDRWNNDKFNRKYLRENLSTGLFQEISKQVVNDGLNGVLVFKCTDTIGPHITQGNIYRYGSGRQLFVEDPFTYYFIPINQTIISSNTFYVHPLSETDSHGPFRLHSSIEYLVKDARCIECYFLPINIFSQYANASGAYIELSSEYYTEGDVGFAHKTVSYQDFPEDVAYIHTLSYNTIRLTMGMDIATFNLGIVKNNKINKIFDKKYCPVLFDENYYRVNFGERNNANVTVPLYYANKDNIKFSLICSLDGSRTYYADFSNISLDIGYGVLYNDTFNISATSDNKVFHSLLSDPWVNYNLYNASAIGMAMGSYALKCFAFGYGANSNINANAEANSYKVAKGIIDRSIIDKRYKEDPLNPHFNKRGEELIRSINRQESDYSRRYNVESVQNAVGSSSSLVSTATVEYNAWLSPMGIRTSYDFATNIINHVMEISLLKYQVNDIESVAQYYHRNGYLVMEYLSNIENLFNYVNTRYYFNVVKTNQIDFNLDVLETENVKDDISYRLSNGIRLWNVENTDIGNYAFDNVERSLL